MAHCKHWHDGVCKDCRKNCPIKKKLAAKAARKAARLAEEAAAAGDAPGASVDVSTEILRLTAGAAEGRKKKDTAGKKGGKLRPAAAPEAALTPQPEESAAGELRGYFSDDTACGELLKNTQTGMYGRLTGSLGDGETRPIAMRQQVHEGPATILVTTEGDTPKEYDIEIISVNYDESQRTRNLRLRVTDPELLEETGGIVQGMSGAPILQDGKLIGAVTHVLVNAPNCGYGIFIENMLEQ